MSFCKNSLQDSQSLQKLHLIQYSLKECVWSFYIALTFLDIICPNLSFRYYQLVQSNFTKANSNNFRMNQNHKQLGAHCCLYCDKEKVKKPFFNENVIPFRTAAAFSRKQPLFLPFLCHIWFLVCIEKGMFCPILMDSYFWFSYYTI